MWVSEKGTGTTSIPVLCAISRPQELTHGHYCQIPTEAQKHISSQPKKLGASYTSRKRLAYT